MLQQDYNTTIVAVFEGRLVSCGKSTGILDGITHWLGVTRKMLERPQLRRWPYELFSLIRLTSNPSSSAFIDTCPTLQ